MQPLTASMEATPNLAMSAKDFLAFDYSPLSDCRASTRILNLQPASSEYDIITCSFEHAVPGSQTTYVVHEPVDLAEAPRDHVLLCDDALLPVSEETYLFLLNLRNQSDQRLRRVWSPHVSINHEDEEEPSMQAQLMPAIFQNALQRISMTPKYKQIPLSTPDHIRVIELDPPGLSNGVLKTRIRAVSLAEAPIFWYLDVREGLTEDSWPDKTPIICNGRLLSLPTPLAQILSVVLRSKGPRAFWTPSICHDKGVAALEPSLHERIRAGAKEIVGIRQPQYSYRALPEDRPHIRLMKIAPAVASDDVLVLEIGHFPLDDSCPSFVALSYVWGSPNPPWMVCTRDGRYIICTQSLRSALCHLRDRDELIIWADAICINQKNTEEKNKQVLLMSQIYKRASKVAVDLGMTCTNDTHLVCRHFLRVLIKMLSLTRSVLEAVRPERPTLQRHEHAKFGIPNYDHQAWGAWRAMRSTPWFTRSWIVQEVAAGRNVIVLYNGQSFRWKDIDMANRITANEQVDLKTYNGKMNIQNMGDLQGTDKGDLPTLLDLLSTFRSLNATDPRDKVYAFRGLASDADIAPLPEYAKSVEDIFTAFASFFVRQGLTAKLLLDAGQSQAGRKLPSWVPDWSYNDFWHSFNYGKQAAWISLNQLRKDTTQADAKLSISGLIENQQPEKLRIRAWFVDEVIGVSSAVSNTFLYEEVQERARIDKEILDLHDSAMHLGTKLTGTWWNTDLIDAVHRTLLGGSDANFKPLQDFYRQSRIMGSVDPSPEDSGSVKVFDERLRERLSNGRFCITNDAGMGLVPSVCEIGDKVCMIEGMQSYAALRKKGVNNYVLIGDAWVLDHGQDHKSAVNEDLQATLGEANFVDICIV